MDEALFEQLEIAESDLLDADSLGLKLKNLSKTLGI